MSEQPKKTVTGELRKLLDVALEGKLGPVAAGVAREGLVHITKLVNCVMLHDAAYQQAQAAAWYQSMDEGDMSLLIAQVTAMKAAIKSMEEKSDGVVEEPGV